MDLLAPLLAWNSMEVHYNHDCQNLGLLATNICRCLLLDVGVGYISYISGWWVCWKNNQLAEHAGSTRLDLPLSHCISISHEIWFYIQYEESKQTWRSDHIFLDGEAISIVSYQFPEPLQQPSYHWSTRKRQGRRWPLVGGVGYRFAVEGSWRFYPQRWVSYPNLVIVTIVMMSLRWGMMPKRWISCEKCEIKTQLFV